MSRIFQKRLGLLLTKRCGNNSLFRDAIRLSTTQRSKEIIVSDFCKPVGAYSAAVKANGFIFVSGQIGLDPATKQFKSDDVEGQTEQVLTNIKGILNDAGSSVDKICKVTVLLSDINDFSKVNSIYANFFTESNVNEPPARAAYAVANLPLNAKVEIEAIATE
eukprot:41246_1